MGVLFAVLICCQVSVIMTQYSRCIHKIIRHLDKLCIFKHNMDIIDCNIDLTEYAVSSKVSVNTVSSQILHNSCFVMCLTIYICRSPAKHYLPVKSFKYCILFMNILNVVCYSLFIFLSVTKIVTQQYSSVLQEC